MSFGPGPGGPPPAGRTQNTLQYFTHGPLDQPQYINPRPRAYINLPPLNFYLVYHHLPSLHLLVLYSSHRSASALATGISELSTKDDQRQSLTSHQNPLDRADPSAQIERAASPAGRASTSVEAHSASTTSRKEQEPKMANGTWLRAISAFHQISAKSGFEGG